ncbi:hypothetical protein B0H12DRAFT_1229883 [Mycena haematopus]|nr:hypothetical protein B0H12DRAFT_1229883 [Mycena haematopus]
MMNAERISGERPWQREDAAAAQDGRGSGKDKDAATASKTDGVRASRAWMWGLRRVPCKIPSAGHKKWQYGSVADADGEGASANCANEDAAAVSDLNEDGAQGHDRVDAAQSMWKKRARDGLTYHCHYQWELPNPIADSPPAGQMYFKFQSDGSDSDLTLLRSWYLTGTHYLLALALQDKNTKVGQEDLLADALANGRIDAEAVATFHK